jgi:hypothetical protein
VTVEHAEKMVLNFLDRAFEELGFARSEASVRSRILLSVNLAPLLSTQGIVRSKLFRRTLEILTDGARPPAPNPKRRGSSRAGINAV